MSRHDVEAPLNKSQEACVALTVRAKTDFHLYDMRTDRRKCKQSNPPPIYRVRYHRPHPHEIPLTTSPLMRSDEDKKPVREVSRSRNYRTSTHRSTVQRRSGARSPFTVREESHALLDSPPVPLKTEKSYRLEIVQHPIKCAEFGTSPLTRLPLSPPLIVQLHVCGGEIEDEMELPFLVAQLALFNADGLINIDQPHPDVQSPTSPRSPLARSRGRGAGEWQQGQLDQQMLYGSLVASPQFLRNFQGKQGLYFLFPDVSVRWKGQYRLGVSLLRLPGLGMITTEPPSSPRHGGSNSSSSSGNVLARVQTYPFDAVPRGDYIAPAQTPLTQYFIQQGARMYAFASSASAAHFPR